MSYEAFEDALRPLFAAAERRGAERMREKIAAGFDGHDEVLSASIRALPLPGDEDE
jgi:hypothetical protein